MRADVPVECVIDAHVHMPVVKEVGEFNSYVRGLVESGVRGAVILGIPPFRDVLADIPIDEVRAEHERVRGLIERLARDIMDQLEPEALYLSAVKLAESFCSFARHSQAAVSANFPVLFPANLSLPPDELEAQLEAAIARGFRGFKVISTLFLKRLDSEQVESVIKVAEAKGVPVVVHGGCDPGIWELPRYCKYGDPSKLEPVLSRHRDAVVTIAHAGGYSAIAPGVFFEETMSLARRFDNVYADTSALPPQLVPEVVRDFPAGRVMYGSDYPAVSNASPREYMEEVFMTLLASGMRGKGLEGYAHGTAEEVYGASCIDGAYSSLEL
ncbi:amidohydrolase family protein [Acidilobus sp. 7A]|uniref:amidohydrolase family protein n=1 Tax=Acidilobus sp. 7A TaxID=1577685 RepID=UPI000764D3CA|nr:amidohydrolase family protein [Acidilobus sp. 7A]AMD30132.1 metal-dependent hydrolase [Acidilobus sp. 7A]